MLARLKQNNAGIVDRHFKRAQVWEGMKDFNAWSNAFFAGCTGIPNTIFTSFSTIIIASLGFDSFTALLLIMPLGAITCISVFGSAWITRHYPGWRYYMMIVLTIPALVGSFITWLGPRGSPGVL